MNLKERWEKQNNSVKLLMKKLRRHDTFVVAVAVVIALALCGGLIYMSTPVVAASARDQVVQKENKDNKKTTEKLDELHNYLTDIDKMIVKNQKGIDSYYEKTKNDRLEVDKNTDTVSEKVSGLGTNLKNLHTSVSSTESRIESLKEIIENGNGETREKASKEFDEIGRNLENIKNEYENVKKQTKELMEDLDNEIRTEVKNGDEKLTKDSVARYEELLSKLSKFDNDLEKRNLDSVTELKSNLESLSEELARRMDESNSENKAMNDALGEKIENYNSDSKAMSDALGQKIENYNSDNKAMSDALGQKIENYNSDSKAMSDALGQKIEGYNSDSKARGDQINERITNINSDMNSNMNGIKNYIDSKSAGINTKLDQVFQRVSNGKKLLASALLTKGVKIKEDATFMEFVRAIENIPAKVVIDSGDTAASIEYDYHYHKDGKGQVRGDNSVSPDRYGGCYKAPVYHRHNDGCYTTRSIYIVSTGMSTRRICHVEDINGSPVFRYRCDYCDKEFISDTSHHEETIYSFEEAKRRNGSIRDIKTETIMTCNKNESYVEGYAPSCGYAHGQVVSAHIKFNGRNSKYNSSVPAINSSKALRSQNSISTRAVMMPFGNLNLNEDEIKSRLDALKEYEEPEVEDESAELPGEEDAQIGGDQAASEASSEEVIYSDEGGEESSAGETSVAEETKIEETKTEESENSPAEAEATNCEESTQSESENSECQQ